MWDHVNEGRFTSSLRDSDNEIKMKEVLTFTVIYPDG